MDMIKKMGSMQQSFQVQSVNTAWAPHFPKDTFGKDSERSTSFFFQLLHQPTGDNGHLKAPAAAHKLSLLIYWRLRV